MLTVIAPHLDDAVLSVYLAMVQADEVEVITCFAGVPPEGSPLADWDRRCGYDDPGAAARLRRQADERALSRCGARAEHLDFLDVDYRTTDPATTQAALTEALRTRLADADEVWLPVGLGGHLDHRLTGRATLAALSDRNVDICVYADQPYASVWGWPDWVAGGAPRLPAAWTRYPLRWRTRQPAMQWSGALAKLGLTRELPHTVRALTPEQLEDKLLALEPYAEQTAQLSYGPHGRWTLREAMRYEAWWVAGTRRTDSSESSNASHSRTI